MREDSTHGHHQMVNTEIRLIIFFAAKDGEVLYSQQKKDQEVTVAQIMNSLLPNSDNKKNDFLENFSPKTFLWILVVIFEVFCALLTILRKEN